MVKKFNKKKKVKSKKVTPKEGHIQFLTMSVFNVDNSHEGMPSELALFDLPPIQVAVSVGWLVVLGLTAL